MKKKKFVKGTAFLMQGKGFLAFGLALKNGCFVLLKGSSFRLKQAQNLSKYRKGAEQERARFLDEGIVIFRSDEENPVFADDYKFKNISHCTSIILGQSRSGDAWLNSKQETYPEWAKRKLSKTVKPKEEKATLKKGNKIRTKNGERFLVSAVVQNQDEKGKKFFEYLLVPEVFLDCEGFLVPEKKVLNAVEVYE